MVVGQAASWFREACAIADLVCLGYVLPCDWRTCGVVLGPRSVRSLFKFAFDCVYQFVHLFRDADCVVCLLLSVNFFCGRLAPLFEGRCRAIPSVARPRCALAICFCRGLVARFGLCPNARGWSCEQVRPLFCKCFELFWFRLLTGECRTVYQCSQIDE